MTTECTGAGPARTFAAGAAPGFAARGFTLIEVLVALAVVAVALPALLFSLNQQVDGTAYLRDKSLAAIVMANKLQEVRIVARAQDRLAKGKDSGMVELADREWFWWLDIQTTEVENFFRVEISVAREEALQDSPLAYLVAFMRADLQPDPGDVED